MKKNILIIFGGMSSEHEISCRSAATVFEGLNKEKYNPVLLGITKEGRWLVTESTSEEIKNGVWEKGKSTKPAIVSPDRINKGIIIEGTEKIPIYCAIPMTHGKWGEDGCLQGLLELSGIPYVGAGVFSSAAAMDKVITKMIADKVGIKQAKYIDFTKHDFLEKPIQTLEKIETFFEKKYPLFIKPANAGSSVGISKAHDLYELTEGIKKAGAEDNKIIIEEAIIGREVEVAVLGNRNPKASPVGEILSVHDFYDYESKYIIDAEQTRIAKDLNDWIQKKLQEVSMKIYEALDCKGLARVDFFIKEKSNEVIFNEINTLPGFTSVSMYPKLWKAGGVYIEELLEELIELALEREEI